MKANEILRINDVEEDNPMEKKEKTKGWILKNYNKFVNKKIASSVLLVILYSFISPNNMNTYWYVFLNINFKKVFPIY